MRKTTRATVHAEVSGLPPQARLRMEHAGRWVAWAEDGRRIVAAGDEYDEGRAVARRAGVERAVCEWLPPLDEARSTGGV